MSDRVTLLDAVKDAGAPRGQDQPPRPLLFEIIALDDPATHFARPVHDKLAVEEPAGYEKTLFARLHGRR